MELSAVSIDRPPGGKLFSQNSPLSLFGGKLFRALKEEKVEEEEAV